MIRMGKILLAQQDGVKVLKFVGDVRVTLCPTISAFINEIGKQDGVRSIVLDLTETQGIDSTALGMMAKISLRSQEVLGALPTIVSSNDNITRILMSMGFDNVFVIVSGANNEIGPMGELPTQPQSEEVMRDQVLEAHRVLMSLNQNNQDTFCDLVEALENEKRGLLPPRKLSIVR